MLRKGSPTDTPPPPSSPLSCTSALFQNPISKLIDVVIIMAGLGISAFFAMYDSQDLIRGFVLALALFLFLKEVLAHPRSILSSTALSTVGSVAIATYARGHYFNTFSDAFSASQILLFVKIFKQRWDLYAAESSRRHRFLLALHDPNTAQPYAAALHILLPLSIIGSTAINLSYDNATQSGLTTVSPFYFWISMYLFLGFMAIDLLADYFLLLRETRQQFTLPPHYNHVFLQFFLCLCHLTNVTQGLGLFTLDFFNLCNWESYTAFAAAGLALGTLSALRMPFLNYARNSTGLALETERVRLNGVLNYRLSALKKQTASRYPLLAQGSIPELQPLTSGAYSTPSPPKASKLRRPPSRQFTVRERGQLRMVAYTTQLEKPAKETRRVLRLPFGAFSLMNSVKLVLNLLSFGYNRNIDPRLVFFSSLGLGICVGLPGSYSRYYHDRLPEYCHLPFSILEFLNSVLSNLGDVCYFLSLSYGAEALISTESVANLGQEGHLVNDQLNGFLFCTALFILLRNEYLHHLAEEPEHHTPERSRRHMLSASLSPAGSSPRLFFHSSSSPRPLQRSSSTGSTSSENTSSRPILAARHLPPPEKNQPSIIISPLTRVAAALAAAAPVAAPPPSEHQLQ